jgi:hypothetical protein
MFVLIAAVSGASSFAAVAQTAEAAAAAKSYTSGRHPELMKQYEEFLSMPNVALELVCGRMRCT